MDVIIIGAGVAGLAAADELTRAGIKPLVIEARDRIGGRIHTIRDNGTPIELGAEFVHGRPPEIFDLAKQFNLNIAPGGGAFIHLPAQGGTVVVTADPPFGDQAIWKKMKEFAKSSSTDMTLVDFLQVEGLDVSPMARRSLERFVAGFHAADIDKIGVRSIVDTEEAEDAIGGLASFRIEGGYDRLADHLYSRAEGRGATFLLNHPITSVKWKRGFAEVETKSDLQERKTETAAAVLITLPLSMLKTDPGSDVSVRFDPELAAKRDALSRLHMGATRRVTLVCRSKWWDAELKNLGRSDAKLGFLISEHDVPIGVWWSDVSCDTPILTGWTGGNNAAELSKLGDSEVLDRAVTSLRQIFQAAARDIESEIVASHTYDWQHDPFSLGSYSYPGVDGKNAMRELAKPLENTLFFAGEATSFEGYWGTVHGAIASGIRAAREILSTA